MKKSRGKRILWGLAALFLCSMGVALIVLEFRSPLIQSACLDLPQGFRGLVRVSENPTAPAPVVQDGLLHVVVNEGGQAQLPKLALPGFPGAAVAHYADGTIIPAAKPADTEAAGTKPLLSWVFIGEEVQGQRTHVLWFVIGDAAQRSGFSRVAETPDGWRSLRPGPFPR